MQLKSRRLSCSTRRLMVSSTTSTLFSWRSFTGSRVAMPLGLASANRRSSWVAGPGERAKGSRRTRSYFLLIKRLGCGCATFGYEEGRVEERTSAVKLRFTATLDTCKGEETSRDGCRGQGHAPQAEGLQV
ncbi:hypothetical protein EYF80_030100 [Liparis tanakae]|uniref:Uncharacterized protein n=1 Tax=Liparis tanakae TaxID=230148 RepID=A0A4Z2H1T3_9TELE|nr:hypothetical protein EYF80_030100 [Liparis tanakae]